MFVIIVLQKERFDEWDALIAERAEMVMKSQLASNTCKDVFQQCLLGLPENYKECDSYSVSIPTSVGLLTYQARVTVTSCFVYNC